ncbi:hypothetical protein [Cyclobacterium lianum]|nr:hypothetical protein [Cyclobacterium lianum]
MVDPTGLAPDDWVKDKEGKVEWRENVNSAEDLDPQSGDQYLGKSGIGLDETSGNTLVYNSDSRGPSVYCNRWGYHSRHGNFSLEYNSQCILRDNFLWHKNWYSTVEKPSHGNPKPKPR